MDRCMAGHHTRPVEPGETDTGIHHDRDPWLTFRTCCDAITRNYRDDRGPVKARVVARRR